MYELVEPSLSRKLISMLNLYYRNSFHTFLNVSERSYSFNFIFVNENLM